MSKICIRLAILILFLESRAVKRRRNTDLNSGQGPIRPDDKKFSTFFTWPDFWIMIFVTWHSFSLISMYPLSRRIIIYLTDTYRITTIRYGPDRMGYDNKNYAKASVVNRHFSKNHMGFWQSEWRLCAVIDYYSDEIIWKSSFSTDWKHIYPFKDNNTRFRKNSYSTSYIMKSHFTNESDC